MISSSNRCEVRQSAEVCNDEGVGGEKMARVQKSIRRRNKRWTPTRMGAPLHMLVVFAFWTTASRIRFAAMKDKNKDYIIAAVSGQSLDFGYYDRLRSSSSSFLERRQNVDVYTTNVTTSDDGSSGETEIGLCHLVGLMAFTQAGDGNLHHLRLGRGSGPYKDMVATLLALQHFNDGNGTVVREVEGINTWCPLKFTGIEFLDSAFTIFAGLRDLTEVVARKDPTVPDAPVPCAVIGAERSAVTQPTSTLSSVHNLVQMSHLATSPALDQPHRYPLFSRVVPSDDVAAFFAALYLQNLGVGHVVVLFANDSFGRGYAQTFRRSARQLGYDDVVALPIDVVIDKEQLNATLTRVKEIGFRYVVAVIFEEHYDDVMTNAYDLGIVGPGYHWMFGGGGIQDYLNNRTFDANSAVASATAGIGILQELGGREGYYSFDRFQASWSSLNDDDVTYFNSKVPSVSKGAYQAPPGFFQSELPRLTTGFAYDSIMAMGLAACDAVAKNNPDKVVKPASEEESDKTDEATVPSDQRQRMLQQQHADITYFDGRAHHQAIINGRAFEGVSGVIGIDPTTRSRVPTTALYTLKNAQIRESPQEGKVTVDVVEAVAAMPNENGTDWDLIDMNPFFYAGNATVPPPDLPPLEKEMNYLGRRAIFGGVLCGLVLASSLAFAAWTYHYRNVRVVKASQPFFLLMLCGGTFLMASSIIPRSITDENFTEQASGSACIAPFWLSSLGFNTAISALFAKTWRVNRIFHNPQKFQRLKVTVWDALIPFAVLITITFATLLTWTLVSPMTWVREDSPGTDDFNRPTASIWYCDSDDNKDIPFKSILMGLDIVVVIMANVQAYQARNIHTEYSETRYIALIMGVLLQIWLLGIPLFFLLEDNPQALYVVEVLVTFAMSAAILLFIFIPKLFFLKEHRKELKEKEVRRQERRRRQEQQALSQGHRLSTTTSTTSLAESLGEDGLKVVLVDSAIIDKIMLQDIHDAGREEEEQRKQQELEEKRRKFAAELENMSDAWKP